MDGLVGRLVVLEVAEPLQPGGHGPAGYGGVGELGEQGHPVVQVQGVEDHFKFGSLVGAGRATQRLCGETVR